MLQRLVYIAVIFGMLFAVDLDDDYDDMPITKSLKQEENEPEPSPQFKDIAEVIENSTQHNVNCNNFSIFALECTIKAAKMYNSSRKTPPMPDKLESWCKAIKYLTDCAFQWNEDCKDMTDSHFNEESVEGHVHVVINVCNDLKFAKKYSEIGRCIAKSEDRWEACYTTFKNIVDGQKNKSREWTHYETHFYLCCARAEFRRCTLDLLFKKSECSHEEALTLQKFSVIISEGDVFQNCDHNLMYSNCPGGDPRPDNLELKTLMNQRNPMGYKLNLSNYMTALDSAWLIVLSVCSVLL